jgi:hypothetical protein
MIKKFIYPVIAIILLSSCAGKFSLQKRKYTKGFYFASAKSNPPKERSVKTGHPDAKTDNKETIREEIVSAQIITADLIKPVENASAQNHETKKASLPKHNNQVVASVNNTITQPEKTFKSVELKNNDHSIYNAHAKANSDTNTIVLVILCLIWWLDLLAVYLKDGHAITTNFWITLLLDLLILPGIVFAILVVLDVVDLK